MKFNTYEASVGLEATEYLPPALDKPCHKGWRVKAPLAAADTHDG
jgi:hypothetical protein